MNESGNAEKMQRLVKPAQWQPSSTNAYIGEAKTVDYEE
jgi:hypothetical protein